MTSAESRPFLGPLARAPCSTDLLQPPPKITLRIAQSIYVWYPAGYRSYQDPCSRFRRPVMKVRTPPSPCKLHEYELH